MGHHFYQFNFQFRFNIFIHLYVSVWHMPYEVPTESRRVYQIPGSWNTDNCKLPCRWWKPNSGPLLKQQIFLPQFNLMSFRISANFIVEFYFGNMKLFYPKAPTERLWQYKFWYYQILYMSNWPFLSVLCFDNEFLHEVYPLIK